MKLKRTLFILYKALLIVAVFACTILFARQRPTNRIFVNKYADFYINYADGTSKFSDNQNFGMVNRGDVVTVRLCLPQEPLLKDAVLTFFIYHSVTEIRCGDTLLGGYGADIDARGDMVSSNYFLVPVPDEAWGGEITITLRVTENGAFNRVKNMGLYPGQRAYEYFFDMDLIGFLIGLPMMLLGLVALAVFLLTGQFSGANRKGLYISLFAILASLWILTKTGVQHLFGLDGYIWTQLEFVAAFTIVLPVLLWAFETEEKGSWMRKLLGAAVWINAAFFAVCTLLHVTDTAHYCATLLLSNILTFLSGALLMAFAIRRWFYGSESDKIFFSGMLILFITGLFDLTRMNLYKYLPALFKKSMPSVLAMGMLFFIIYMLRSYFAEAKEKQKTLIMAQIAADNLRKMLTNTPAGICQLEPDERLTIVAANDIFYDIIGYTQKEWGDAGYTSVLAAVGDEGRWILQQKYAALMQSESPTGEVELSAPTKEGGVRTVFARYFYDREKDGKITVNVIDITDRKRMEEELRLSEERYKLALRQSGKVFFFFDVPSRTMQLSDELAKAFGLPTEVDNMPENFLSKGLVEPGSVENYRSFYQRIIAGDASGETVISCHMRQNPETILWYRIAFTSVFDAHGVPQSAIITYDDLQEQRAKEIAGAWKQLNLLSMQEREYAVAEYNLTKNRILSQTGGLFEKMPDFITGFDQISSFVLENFIHEEDVAAYRRFLDRARLLDMFERGETEDSIEYRSLQHGSAPRWTATYIQMIRDPYAGDVLAQLLFRDINAARAGQIEMMQNVEELKKELENSRIKVMINQMQPHFLYNALSAIQTIVRTDPDYAYQLLYDFTVHLRSSIKALSSDAPIPFKDELKNIKAYLNIERMRFGESLKVNYEIDCDEFSVIPLSIQPLAENAARHGVYPKGEAGGTVTVRTYETVHAYAVEVEDDGDGFDANEVLTREGDSVGLKSLIFRLKSLMNADVSILSKPGAGTKVTVTIPKKGD